MKDAKNELRSKLLYARESIPEDDRRAFDMEISSRLITLSEIKASNTVLCYVSFGNEVSTREIIDFCFDNGKTIAVPRCDTEKTELVFHVISSWDDLVPGHYGILEPNGACPVLMDTEKSLCVVPCLSVDERGFRIGYGKGYYDRFLARYKGISVGLCYDVLRSGSNLPFDEHDVPLNIVITDKMILRLFKGADPAR